MPLLTGKAQITSYFHNGPVHNSITIKKITFFIVKKQQADLGGLELPLLLLPPEPGQGEESEVTSECGGGFLWTHMESTP